MKESQDRPGELERRIFELILAFPDRIDEMETRNEENCRKLAARIAQRVEQDLLRRAKRQ